MVEIKPFKKILVANRGEIAIRIFRACTELGIKTVAIYSEEDRLHLHRYKADESYLVGQGQSPICAYLDFQAIVRLAVAKRVDAIHPGYGFLAENPNFARECERAGIVFIGPSSEILSAMGDKVVAKQIAAKAGVAMVPGTPDAVSDDQDALLFAKKAGYPLIIKAAMGGGGRGMSVVHDRDSLIDGLQRCRGEAKAAFGDPKIFLEKFIEKPKHIEIQILGDRYGNIVHLFERDCSVQRRHQKIVEIAPALNLPETTRARLYADALAIAREVQYCNAGTVEFLVDREGNSYFIEVNPRIQVEHTITEIITGRDIVQAQIRVAEGYPLSHDVLRISGQDKIKKSGFAIQLRVTTEDPENNFAPDTGTITTFRTGEGFGIRLDAGSGFEGAVISPHYDSLLIKVCAWSLDFDQAVKKALRAMAEFRIRGVTTNIPFLENVLSHPVFQAGDCNTGFVDSYPELYHFKPRLDRGNKLLQYLGEIIVNGFEGMDPDLIPAKHSEARIPQISIETLSDSEPFAVFRDRGTAGLVTWLKNQKRLLITDTTFRDAHQSLIATRLRSKDIFRIAPATAWATRPYFSHEMWGGATFDVALRFLHECPWERLRVIRRLLPGTLLQMLLRSGNAVGYTNYPDNVVDGFIRASARNGIDVFRIFDAMNWVEGMKPCIQTVIETGKIAEAAICYSGDITDGRRVKFTLKYYLDLARELRDAGTHILGIKDMAGLIKPEAARILISELRDHIDLPIHLHTHDTSGNGVATLLAASKAGVNIVDAALSSMSGVTSQPSLNALVCALQGTERDTLLAPERLQKLSDYWEEARNLYAPFECGLKAGTADVYRHEIPGGQYSNFKPQAAGLGLGNRWEEVKEMYRSVNDMLGEVIKVTPTSKACGDMALFMVQNNLTPAEVVKRSRELNFPDSMVSLMRGMMGQPHGGFPEEVRAAILRGEKGITCRPGELLEDFDFASARAMLKKRFGRDFSEEDELSYSLYPQVFLDYCRFVEEYGDISVLNTPTFFYGLKQGEEKAITIQEGKTLIIKLLAISELEKDGRRTIFFELNGSRRSVIVVDKSSGITGTTRPKADPDKFTHIGAPMAGKVVKVFVREGETVAEGQKLLSSEAMKLLSVITSPAAGTVKRLHVGEGDSLAPKDLVLEMDYK